MVEFGFNVKTLFPEPIIKINHSLVPVTFVGNKLQLWEASQEWAEIIDCLGKRSAMAQDIKTPVTTAEKMRMSDNQSAYISADINAGRRGVVIGFIKLGKRDIYFINDLWKTEMVRNTACVLDFYIHETYQRQGYGKKLFDAMLKKENLDPVKFAIDKPSNDMLCFLKKHYSLLKIIPQANNFVVFKGFFNSNERQGNAATSESRQGKRNESDLDIPLTKIGSSGRYEALHPQSSVAQIVFSETDVIPKKGDIN